MHKNKRNEKTQGKGTILVDVLEYVSSLDEPKWNANITKLHAWGFLLLPTAPNAFEDSYRK
jgi:hypothetical protein